MADIYKRKDSAGITTYSDTNAPGSVKTNFTTGAPTARPAANPTPGRFSSLESIRGSGVRLRASRLALRASSATSCCAKPTWISRSSTGT